jgi:hypothetical protein
MIRSLPISADPASKPVSRGAISAKQPSSAARDASNYTRRASIFALAALLTTASAAPAIAQTRSWNTGGGNWSNAANWTPAGVPGAGQTANLGNLAGVQNSSVTLNQNATVAALNLTDAMRLLTAGNRLTVTDQLVVAGFVASGGQPPTLSRSTLRIDPAAGAAVTAARLTMDNGGAVTLYDGTLVEISDLLTLTGSAESAQLGGHGIIRFGDSGTTFVNGGVLRGGTSPGLTLQQMNGGLFDLDGAAGGGSLELSGENGARMRLIGTGLTDSFSGWITMTRGAELQVDLSSGWTSDAQSGWAVHGVYPGLSPARVSGAALTFAGVLQVVGDDARLEFAANTTFTPESRTLVGTVDRLVFGVGGASATIDGGEFEVAAQGQILFNGPTLLRGGTFDRITDDSSSVRFAGPTTYSGVINGTAHLRQIGTATVNTASTVNTEYFDMDGPSADAVWNIYNSLALNVVSIDSPNTPGEFNGTLHIAGGLIGRLNVNLRDANASWRLAGTTTLGGEPTLFPTRLAGSPVELHGALTVPSGKAQITARTTFASGAAVSLPAASAQLRINAPSQIEAGATFSGAGLLINGANGVMDLEDGATTGPIPLQNLGTLSLAGLDAGIATVPTFENGPGARLRVSVGGNPAGTHHDLLIVSAGPATLAGELAVDMFNIGNGQYVPQIGDEFTVIVAAGGLNGAFAGAPISCASTEQYHWQVIYEPNEVTIRLAAITDGFPGDLNCDCIVSVGDISAFVLALTDADAYASLYPDCGIENADVNADGVVSVGDISGFVALLTQ